MVRLVLPLGLLLSLGASAPPSAMPDVAEVGRAAAGLPQDQIPLYFLMVVIAMMIVERGLAAWNMSKEREKMWAVADKFGDAADKLGEAMGELKTELAVLRAVSARVESTTYAER